MPGIHIYGPVSGPYNNLVWSDSFDGPAGTAPNPAIWTPDLDGGCGDNTLSTSTASTANAQVDGQGNLTINALHDASGYTSAELNTRSAFSFRYGRLEARIALPRGSGLCSAFWMVGDSVTQPCFPGCGEIDVMEAISPYPNVAYATLHGPVTGSGNYQQWEHFITSATSLTGAFHTYGVTWTPTKITWTLDGVPWVTAAPKDLPPSATWVFTHPFHIILDVAVGGWPGDPAAGAVFPATMRVAWVRLYN